MAHDFFRFLTTSMATLETEVPMAYAALGAALAGLRSRLKAGSITHVVWFEGSRFLVTDGAAPADIEVAFERQSILDLIDGEISLQQAVLADRLQIRGPVEAVERFHEGFCVYVDGAVRSPGFPALLEQYRMLPPTSERQATAS